MPRSRLPCKRRDDRAWDGPNAELQCGLIGHQVRDQATDASLYLGNLGERAAIGRLLDLHALVDSADVNEAVAVGAGHARVDLRDDEPCAFDRGERHVDRCAQRAEAMRVRRRHVDERDVDGNLSPSKKPGDIGQEHRNVLGAPLVDRPRARSPR